MEEAMADRLSQSSFDLCNTQLSAVNSSHVVKLAAVIISVGRCNDLKSTYAIYIIDVTKVNETLNKSENWQTYRRFNDFYDLHLTIKKKVSIATSLFHIRRSTFLKAAFYFSFLHSATSFCPARASGTV